jgi:uncharacterized protein (DUF433 family)
MNLERLNGITVEEGKCGGRPCIRGQRILVTDVLELLGAGASFEEILADYSFPEREDILAAIDYAALSDRPCKCFGAVNGCFLCSRGRKFACSEYLRLSDYKSDALILLR